MSQNVTSLTRVCEWLLLAIVCCCAWIGAESSPTLESMKKNTTNKKGLIIESKKRIRRQFDNFGGGSGGEGGLGDGFNNNFGGSFNGNFGGFGNNQRPNPNNGPVFSGGGGNGGSGLSNQLIFSGPSTNNANSGNFAPAVTTQSTFVSNDQQGGTNSNVAASNGQLVFINNRPTIATMAPFTGRTTASPQYLSCFNSCQTTSEYNPICGSDQELYFNEQKFNCARRCGADIQIVRRGSCSGLFPMMRG